MSVPRQKAVLRLEIGNVWVSAKGGPRLLKKIDEVLTFKVPGSFFSPSFQKKQWDGMKRFVRKTREPQTILFQTGILPHLLKRLPMQHIRVSIIDLRILPFDLSTLEGRIAQPSITEESWTEDLKYVSFTPDPRKIKYQVACINACLHNTFLGLHWPRGVVDSAVASGKAAMIAGLVKTIKLPVLFTVNRLDLVRQIRDTFSEILPPDQIGQIGGGKFQMDKRYTVSSIRSLDERRKDPAVKKFLESVGVWLVDESHMAADNGYYRVSNLMPRAYYRFGYTGSAFMKSEIVNMYSRSIFGDVIFSLKSKKLIEDGLTTKPIINLINGGFSKRSILPSKATPADLYREQITTNEDRNALICQIAVDDLKKGRRPVILVSFIEHGEILCALLSPFWKCSFVSGDIAPEDRPAFYSSFESGEMDLLIVSSIFDMGIDVPSISTIILAGAGKDSSRMVQRVGRGVRLSKGKTHLMVYDFKDQTPPFSKQVDSRMQACADQGWEVVIRDVAA